ncbi:unnamed protein product [Arabidopsis halleri]
MAEKETPPIVLQFAPLNSSVYEGFWYSFSSLKLDKLGIDDSPIPITGRSHWRKDQDFAKLGELYFLGFRRRDH